MNLFKTFRAGPLLAGFAALALISCGQKDKAEGPQSETSAKAAKVNAGSPLDVEFRLKNATAIDVDALLALIADKSPPTYESTSFDEKLGATIVSNLRFADGNDGEAVLVERAEFYGVDMEAIERVKSAQDVEQNAESDGAPDPLQQFTTGNLAEANGPFEMVAKKVRFLNVSTEGFENDPAETEITIGGIEIDQLEIRQGGLRPYGLSNLPAGMVNTVNLAGVYFKDISVNAAGEETAALSFSAPDLRFVGIGGGKLNTIIANDFEYKMSQTDQSLAAMYEAMGPQVGMILGGPLRAFIAPENQRVTMESLVWRDIDLSGVLAFALRDEEPPLTADALIDLGTLEAANMETFIAGRRAAVVDETTISAAEFTWLVPSKFRTDSKGAVYDFSAYVPESEEELLSIIKEHGLDNVKGDGYMEWVWIMLIQARPTLTMSRIWTGLRIYLLRSVLPASILRKWPQPGKMVSAKSS